MPDTPNPARKDTAGVPGSVVEFPGTAEVVRPPYNLPLQLSSFIGREREIAEVEALLADNRLLTLTGAGGSGKTRLGLAAAPEVAGEYEDGVWLVELAPLSDPDLVPQAVAAVFGVRETPGTTLTESLTDYLGSRKTLLFLDNCEHLVDACASLAEALLRSCQNLRILATSREALGVSGETIFAVPPLSLPDPRHLPAVEGLPHYEAARLFVERAKALKPGFEITEQNALAVAQVCFRLDGMPLAIELAAARTKVLTVEQISNRLEESLRLLSSGRRTAMPHHRTLRATMDWSYGLLSEEERTLFRRLSVFAGGFALEAAERVGSGEGIEDVGILDLLASLVDKSLVLFEEWDGEARYRLLETVRQYASEMLEEAEEAERIRRRHASRYLALAEEAEPELKGTRQAEWLDRLEEDHDNLRAAIRWALERGETEMALRLTASAAHLRYPRGHLTEGRRQLEAALAATGGPPAARAKALTELGWFALEQSDYDRAQGSLEASLLLYRQLEDKYGIAHALECLVVAQTRLGVYARATQLQEESLALYRGLGHEWGIAMSLTNLGILAQKQGHYERATALHQESLALLRGVGDAFTIGYVLSLLGQDSLKQGQLERGAALLEESQSLLRRLGDKPTLTTTLRNLGETVFYQGDGARAAVLYRESLALAVEVGSKTTAADCLEGLAGVALAQAQPDSAARLRGAAEAMRAAMGLPPSSRNHPRPDHEDRPPTARSQVDEAAWEAAWSEGRAMTLEQAVEYALQPPTPPEEAEEAPPAYPAGLSAREVEVLKLVAQGMTDPRIAEELYISPRTVNAHLRSVYHKIGSSTRAEATRFASEHDLL